MEEYRQITSDTKVEARDSYRKLKVMLMKLEILPFSFDALVHEHIQDTMRYVAQQMMITGGVTYGPAGEF